MKRKSGCASFLLVIACLWLFTMGLDWLRNTIDRARFPWGYASPGRSTLAGTCSWPATRDACLIPRRFAPRDDRGALAIYGSPGRVYRTPSPPKAYHRG